MRLTSDQHDALVELVNIGVGRAAAALSDLAAARVELSVPNVIICSLEELKIQVESNLEPFETLICQDFKGGLSGRAVLAFPRTSALKFVQLLGNLSAVPVERDLDLSGILMEVGNIVLNSVMGSIGNISGVKLACLLPEVSTDNSVVTVMAAHLAQGEPMEHSVFLADVQFQVAERDIRGSIAILFEVGGISTLLKSLMVYSV
jgi:chemotaxis protein CheC